MSLVIFFLNSETVKEKGHLVIFHLEQMYGTMEQSYFKVNCWEDINKLGLDSVWLEFTFFKYFLNRNIIPPH